MLACVNRSLLADSERVHFREIIVIPPDIVFCSEMVF
jgi:hypothetical protein